MLIPRLIRSSSTRLQLQTSSPGAMSTTSAATPQKWSHLIRLRSPSSGEAVYADAIPSSGKSINAATTCRLISGDPLGTYTLSTHPTPIPSHPSSLLSPFPASATRTVRCLGLNYALHARESNMPLPTYPVVFHKPSTALSGPFDDIPVPVLAQEVPEVDYEAELVVVIGRVAKNVSEADALEFVAGYAVGNDVSQRELQLRRGGQWGVGKGFDGWAPWGPGIVATSVLGDAGRLGIWSKVQGEERQRSCTQDMVFGVRRTVSILSRGMTLMPGDLIFTGTPQGVGMGMDPKGWLKDGEVVECGIESIGTIRNKVVFEKKGGEPKL